VDLFCLELLTGGKKNDYTKTKYPFFNFFVVVVVVVVVDNILNT